MSHRSLHAQRVDAKPFDLAPTAARNGLVLVRRSHPRALMRIVHQMSGAEGGPRWSIHLVLVMALDDLGGREVWGGGCCESHHQHHSDREVGGDEQVPTGSGGHLTQLGDVFI